MAERDLPDFGETPDEKSSLYNDPDIRVAVPRAAFSWGGETHADIEAALKMIQEKHGLTLDQARKLVATLNSRRGPDRMGK